MPAANVVTAERLRLDALQVHGLEPVSFDAAGGECIAIDGASGTGKTVLLRGIADLDPAPGRVFFDDRERSSYSGPEWRKHVRYVAAEPGWWAETARPQFPKVNGVDALLESLGLEPGQLDQDLHRLSTGERQRMALVRSIIDDPPVILLDEPTAALDSGSTMQVENLIKGLVEDGRVILLVSHDPAQIERLACRKYLIENGKLRKVPVKQARK